MSQWYYVKRLPETKQVGGRYRRNNVELIPCTIVTKQLNKMFKVRLEDGTETLALGRELRKREN